MWLFKRFLLLSVLTSFSAIAQALEQADTVLYDGKVVTVDEVFSIKQVPEDEIRTIKSVMTLVGGQIVYQQDE